MISETALKEHKIAHAFGSKPSRAPKFAPLISQMIERLGVTEVLDYGCGKGELAAYLKAGHAFKLQLYDPAIEEYAGEAIPMQMVVCIDVLEHVETEHRKAVLDDLERVTGGAIFIVSKAPFEEWLDDLMDRFDLQTLQVIDEGFYCIAYAQSRPLIEVPK